MIRWGTYRVVFLVGSLAIKLPRPKHFSAGMRCNRWERETWQVWRPVFGWENLCPVLAADPLGLVLFMPRAQQPVSQAEAHDALHPDYYPGVDAETKAANFGRLGSAVLVLDYGLPDEDDVQQRRSYLGEHRKRLSRGGY